MSSYQPTSSQSHVLMTKKEFIQNSKDSHDSLIECFAMQYSDLAVQRIIDKDFLKISESIMRKVWDNQYDDVWDTT